jgi:hypothetical protein
VGRAVNLLGEGHVTSDADGVFELVARARTARMFALERGPS